LAAAPSSLRVVAAAAAAASPVSEIISSNFNSHSSDYFPLIIYHQIVITPISLQQRQEGSKKR
jgi:hypothetical protein